MDVPSSYLDPDDMSSTNENSLDNLIFHATNEDFKQFCVPLNISDDVLKQANSFLTQVFRQEIFNSNEDVENQHLFACIVYVTLIDMGLIHEALDQRLDNETVDSTQLTITDILVRSNTNIKKFFDGMHILKDNLDLSEEVYRHLAALEKKYCVVLAMYHTFSSRLCPAVFKDESKEEEQSDLPQLPETDGVAFRTKLTWTLFLLTKHKTMPENQELLQHFQCLLCCLEYILRQTPSFLLNPPYGAIRFGAQNQDVTMLRQLASDFDVVFEETQALQEKYTEPFFHELLNKDGELDFDRLSDRYQKLLRKTGELDERLFLCKNSCLVPSSFSRMLVSPSNHSNISPQQMTPVRVALSSVQQLNSTLKGLKNEPSDTIIAFFMKCENNPQEKILRLIESMQKKFVEQYKPTDTSIGEARFTQAVKLYYRVLESLLQAEGESSKLSLSLLLNKEEFHKAMLSCSVEVILTIYGQSWDQNLGAVMSSGCFKFPWILQVFELQAYDFYKVIESFIKYEPSLSVDVVKHLQSIEMEVLEHLAWKADSPLFKALCRWEPGQIPTPGASPQSSPHCGTRTATELFLSPARPNSSVAQTTSNSTSSDGNTDQPAQPPLSQSLTHFLNKVCRVGYHRLLKLCSLLCISKDLQHKIWTCFEHCIKKAPFLLRNRHIDPIIMCCIYAICKVVDKEILFRSIVNQYKFLPQVKQEVYKHVYIDENRQESVIYFYNAIFISHLKSYIEEFSPHTPSRTPQLSPMPKQSPLKSPTYSVPGRNNFFVSPLKQSPFKAPPSPSQMTPSTRLLFCFGDSVGSSEKLRGFNEKMQSMKNVSAKKRLNMDDVSGSSSKKVLCL